MSETSSSPGAVQLTYIGCWYKKDMYSHNCSNLVDSLRSAGMKVDVITSNCRCFRSAQNFSVCEEELINRNCRAIAIPHAPRFPGKKHGTFKYLAVKILRLDLWLATIRGFLYFRAARGAEVIHFDQVLEAFGCVPLFVLIQLSSWFGKRIVVTVHEIDPFQLEHKWLNRLYNKCSEVFVYSENMKRQVVALGVDTGKVKVMRYGTVIPDIRGSERKRYIYFGGHNILNRKGYAELLDALAILKEKGMRISLLIYVGYGCGGLKEAKEMAIRKNVADQIEWQEFYTGEELAKVYQESKACLIPFSGGSARHPLTCAMVNATPVIATNAVDIPEYLGELGIYVDGSAESIAAGIGEIEKGQKDLRVLGNQLRAKALAELDYQKIAEELKSEYARIGGRAPLVQVGAGNAV